MGRSSLVPLMGCCCEAVAELRSCREEWNAALRKEYLVWLNLGPIPQGCPLPFGLLELERRMWGLVWINGQKGGVKVDASQSEWGLLLCCDICRGNCSAFKWLWCFVLFFSASALKVHEVHHQTPCCQWCPTAAAARQPGAGLLPWELCCAPVVQCRALEEQAKRVHLLGFVFPIASCICGNFLADAPSSVCLRLKFPHSLCKSTFCFHFTIESVV